MATNEARDEESMNNLKVSIQTSAEGAMAEILHETGTLMKTLGFQPREGFSAMSAALGRCLFKLCEVTIVNKNEPMNIATLDQVLRLSVHVVYSVARSEHPEMMAAITTAAQGSVPDDVLAAFKAKINGGLN